MTNTWGPSGPQPPSGWQPPQPQQQPPPPPPPSPGPAGTGPKAKGGFLIGLVAGIAIPVVVGLVLFLTGVLSFGSDPDAEASGSTVDTTPVTMPDTLAGLRLTTAVNTEKGGEKADQINARIRAIAERTAAAYSQAYGGAAAGVQQYADNGLETMLTVIGVRAPSPGVVNGPVQDAEDLGLAALPQEIRQLGDAQCLVVQSRTVPKGETPDPENERVVSCQRSGDDLTVFVMGNAGDGAVGQSAMIAMVDAAYSALSTGS